MHSKRQNSPGVLPLSHGFRDIYLGLASGRKFSTRTSIRALSKLSAQPPACPLLAQSFSFQTASTASPDVNFTLFLAASHRGIADSVLIQEIQTIAYRT